MNYIDKNLLKGERVVFRTKRHWISFAAPAFFALLGVLILLGSIAGIASGQDGSGGALFIGFLLVLPLVFAYLDYISSEFAVTNKRVIGKSGFLRRNSIEILLSKIEAINVEQGILGRMLNYGSITTGGTGSTKNPFSRIADPFSVRRHVQEQVDRFSITEQ